MKRTQADTRSHADETRETQKLVAALLRWFYRHARDLPWRHTRDPYAIWVSEIMLQQTQVKTVVPYWQRWMRELPTISMLADAPIAKLLKLWEGLGYYTRVRNLQKAARVIESKHGGRFPETFDEVLALPGVGRYTAGAVCSIALNQPTPVVDGNVIRVLTRVFGIRQNPKQRTTNNRLWRLAGTLVRQAARLRTPTPLHRRVAAPASRSDNRHPSGAGLSPSPVDFPLNIGTCSALNQALMELGAVTCTPRQPRCPQCPLCSQCVAAREGLTARLPNSGLRRVAIRQTFAAFVFTRRGKVLVRRRPSGVVNAQLWEFPNAELGDRDGDPTHLAANLVGPVQLARIQTINHSITRHRISLEVFHAELKPGRQSRMGAGHWVSLSELARLPFASAHRKIADRLARLPRPASVTAQPADRGECQ